MTEAWETQVNARGDVWAGRQLRTGIRGFGEQMNGGGGRANFPKLTPPEAQGRETGRGRRLFCFATFSTGA